VARHAADHDNGAHAVSTRGVSSQAGRYGLRLRLRRGSGGQIIVAPVQSGHYRIFMWLVLDRLKVYIMPAHSQGQPGTARRE